MFRATVKTLAVTPYVRFLIESRGNKSFGGGPKRAFFMLKAYRGLGAAEKAALKTRADATILPKTKPADASKTRATRASRKPTAYNQFVKKNFGRAGGANQREKFAAIAKLWKAAKKQ